MKLNILYAILFCISVNGYSQNQGQPSIVVKNLLNTAQIDKIVSVSWNELRQKYPAIDTANLKIVSASTKAEIPFQLEKMGTSEVQNLLVQVTVPARSIVKLLLQKGKHKPFATKTYGRYVPERKDDFAWENDKIAFRMYGKALESTNENAYGIDVWVKNTADMVVNDRYKSGQYHTDQGNGLDYYNVGNSLGAGNSAPYLKDSIWYSPNYHEWKVLDNGPLRTTFELTYPAWDAAGQKVSVIKTISLDAGAQLNRIRVQYNFRDNVPLPVVIGIIKRNEHGVAYLDEQHGIMGYWEPQHGVDGITGVGAVVLEPVNKVITRNNQFLSFLKTNNQKSFEYYTGACWNKAGIITTDIAWFSYLKDFKEQIANPLKVTL